MQLSSVMCMLWYNVCFQHFPIAFGGEFQAFLLYGACLKIAPLFLAAALQHRIAEWLRLDKTYEDFLVLSSSALSFEAQHML